MSIRRLFLGHRGVLLAVGLGVLVRLWVSLGVPQPVLKGDEPYYLASAMQVLAGEKVVHFPFRPPLYVYFCALALRFFGPDPACVRVAQALLEGASILGIYVLGLRTLGRRSALLAAWFYALFPDLIAFSSWLWSESLVLGVLVWSLVALVHFDARPSLGRAVLVGLVWGLSALVKPYHLYLTPLFFAWVVYRAHGAERSKALWASAAGLLVFTASWVPWSVYISRVHGRPIVICETGALNLRDGTNNYRPPVYDYPFNETFSRSENAKVRRTESLPVFILKNPGLFASRATEKMSMLFAPTSFAIRHVYLGKYGTPQRIRAPVRIGTSYAVIVSNLLVLAAGALGLVLARRRAPFLFATTVIYVGVYLLMITITPSLTRYRLPILVFAFLYAAYLLADPRANLRALRQPSSWVPAGLLGGTLIALWAARVPQLVEAIW